MYISILRIELQRRARLFLGSGHLVTRNKEGASINASFDVVRIEIDGFHQFAEGALPGVHLRVRQSQLVVTFRIVLVHPQGVGELDSRFAILGLLHVALSALEVFLLADIWIPRAPGKEREAQQDREPEAHQPRLSKQKFHGAPILRLSERGTHVHLCN